MGSRIHVEGWFKKQEGNFSLRDMSRREGDADIKKWFSGVSVRIAFSCKKQKIDYYVLNK